MRLKCDFTADRLPISHNMMFVSLIKEALKKSHLEYFNKLYTYNGKSNKKSKNFCFSVKMKGFDVDGDIVNVKDGVSLLISSPDAEFILYLYNGLLKINEFNYKDFCVNRTRISMMKEKCVDSREVIFRTISPICIKNNQNYFLKIDDENYENELNYIAGKVLENYRGTGLEERLVFHNVKMKNVIVRQDIREFEKSSGRDYLYVNSYEGIFKLCGSTKDLQDLYSLGLGFKRNQGFGMLELVY
ncbi:CRISPR-associated endoribonuclease Cas6 [Acetivibrio mesophilus]|uniref:CRISPR-associated endoribonuclease Cas6 n=1 Tax=Acetivibrio mesophilus TaxID=2487273 RepID=A0A4Q0I797_9FIRM|nr:CRISPR-associated endoribonuclease Cas6 [Acetivibrio mesophilus]ODM27290.1 CRISPR-associated endoribonuclease Cas6 [Clostridium sp. Bc-iso-3]RXE58872.1 CRISPR-associated endoribonuclease Cas6 [Acetivibrio mesophilus]HHV29532.1 CRISPR-associated endoribonuclease Cas6 [Clostridium sp.]